MHPAYEAFLDQVAANPTARHVPSPEADAHWHEHLLDTRGYAEMCQERFGRFLHHEPATGAGYCAATLEA
jgi:hypothetical protein